MYMSLSYGWQNAMPPQDVHPLILRACEYITFQGKKDSVNVIKDTRFRSQDCSGLSA